MFNRTWNECQGCHRFKLNMSKQFRFPTQACALAAIVAFTISLAGCGGLSSNSTSPPPGNPVGANLVQVSSDSFTVGPGQHSTEVEPHVLSNGTTMVAAFQVGRLPRNGGVGGGSTDIGW